MTRGKTGVGLQASSPSYLGCSEGFHQQEPQRDCNPSSTATPGLR